MEDMENYEKKYKEALGWMQSLYNGLHGKTKEEAERYFPELKESEDVDKKIREEIIATIHLYYGKPLEDEVKEMIAWLEKQVEYKSPEEVLKIRQELYQSGYNDGYKHGCEDSKKQGEQKPAIEMKSAEESLGIDSETYNKIVDECIYSEQKSTDKVEPKFKVGDWVIFNEHHNSVYQVEKIQGLRYYLRHYTGGSLSVHIDNELIKSWTIQDAKDGDVLASELCGTIMLYKGIEDNNIQFYCDYDFSDIDVPGDRFAINNGQHYGSVDDSDDWHPATKEQRDLLFQKMKEAGYEWDAEQKELKKIEQKPTEDVDLPEFESHLCLMFQKFKTKVMCTNGEIIDYVKEHSQKLRDILVKSDWGEEDERKIYRIYSILGQAADTHAFSTSCRLIGDKECIELQDFLKSLRPQNRWKPSDEQIECLSDAIKHYNSLGYPASKLKELLDDLKKLRDE